MTWRRRRVKGEQGNNLEHLIRLTTTKLTSETALRVIFHSHITPAMLMTNSRTMNNTTRAKIKLNPAERERRKRKDRIKMTFIAVGIKLSWTELPGRRRMTGDEH